MQLFVKALNGKTVVVHANEKDNVHDVAARLAILTGVPVCEQLLLCHGRQLNGEQDMADAGVKHGSSLTLTCRLRGGVPVKVKMLTNHLPCGEAVCIDIEANTPLLEVKRQLQEATGVPIEHQKVMLGGVSQLVMGDKRTNIKYSYCGTSSNMYLAVAKTANEKQ